MRTRPQIAAILATLIVAVPIAGCGSSDSDAAKKTATDFYAAVRSGNGAKACSLLTPQEAQALPGTGGVGGGPPSCASGIQTLASVLPDATLKSAKVTGKDATVVLGSSQGFSTTISLQKTDKGWRVASFR